ncbi:acetolactate synthase [Actinosynnema sp. ALI-1.44]|uniref:thiamine pyrophosphate-binding protein n=1 Tax=Actinosynnema sp. ALI-1.44 TaxID=1933779 RepID=UPI00097C6623|nr:thiamine pyrophosphate-binding protein [Actinosynnema sp. ALI-1.44]ONI74889.1 acetolactate synthase [Actinosynnema sp. ALI-1.44]
MSRTGGDLVVESLVALGARTVFGLPGQHALGLFHAVHRSSLRYFGSRTEVNAAFAADGHARTTGEVTPLFVSTGPGALQTLAGLQEAASSSVPVLGVSSQIPVAGLGGRRRGFLHELPDQQASFRDVVKHTRVVRSASQIPSAIAEAWRIAVTAPTGPVWVEIPQDVLLGPAGVPAVGDLSVTPVPLVPRPELLAEAARLLQHAQRPVILAGGGVVRSGAQPELLELAEKLGAPVVSTFGGKGAFPWEHELSLQSWLEDQYTTEVLQDADVLLVVGSGLGELSSNYHTFRPRGRVVQIEADLGKLEANHSALGIHADARLALRALVALVEQRAAVVPDLLSKVRQRLDSQDLTLERDVLAAVRDALPDTAPSFWDMTILAYWAWSAWDHRHGSVHTAQGSGGLGYAFPAALGAASTVDGPVLAVSGDGGAMYGLSELATAKQYGLNVTWLIVDDGGYGILREYMTDAFGEANGTELTRPDFVALAESFGVPAVRSAPERLRADLAKALAADGPAVVVLPALLRMFAPTHLEQ